MAKETNIHAGHRESMRRKYLSLGASAFLPHELLEILLYYAVPVCDTNPTAHRLLDRFGRLSDVLRAGDEELLSVRGVGERSVRLLRLVREIGQRLRDFSDGQGGVSVSLEDFVLSLSTDGESDFTRLILLDGAGRLLSVEHIPVGAVLSPDFEPRLLVEPAIRHRAVTAILCTYPRNRSMHPGAFDRRVTASLRDALALVGVRLAEHFIVTGGYAARLSRQFVGCFESEPDVSAIFSMGRSFTAEDVRVLSALLLYAGCKETEETLTERILAFGGLDRFLTAPIQELVRRGLSERAALLLSLSIAVFVRSSLSEKDKNRRFDSAERLGELFVRYFLGATSERVVILLLDSAGRLLRTEQLSEGVVNGAPIELRRAAEIALLHGASFAVLAHNHPSGSLLPSPEDEEATALIADALASVGVPLIEHFVVAGEGYTPIRLWSPRLGTVRPASFYGRELLARVASLCFSE